MGIPKEGGPIGVMLNEHEMGRDLVRKFSEGIEEYKRGDRRAVEKIVRNARGYIQLLSMHIDKENNILYPMGEMHLTEEKRNELLRKFDEVEEKVIGKGIHEKFHTLVHKLKEIYGE